MTTVALVFGGQSPEHEVSIVSARFVNEQLKLAGFETLLVGIGRNGNWYVGPPAFDALVHSAESEPSNHDLPRNLGADVVFPLVHGLTGEDGCLQGLCCLYGLPYVGGDPLNASLCWDKITTRVMLAAHGLPQLPYVCLDRDNFDEARDLQEIEEKLNYPIFVKPSRTGSSIGVARVAERSELLPALHQAMAYDYRIIVENGLQAREIEVAGLGARDPLLSIPAEIQSENDFYDFEEKYIKDSARFIVPAPLDGPVREKLYDYARRAWRLLNCHGMARIDFLVTETEAYLNEINTCPGFTAISMYPRLLRETGVSSPELMKRLVDLALERHGTTGSAHFYSKADWWKS